MMLTRQPVKGDLVRWPWWAPERTAEVVSLDGNLCWIREQGETLPFIWRSKAELNALAELVEAPRLELV